MSLLGAQESDGQHRHPEHGGVDVDALMPIHGVGWFAASRLPCKPVKTPNTRTVRIVP